MDYRIEAILRSIEHDIGRTRRPSELAGEVCLSVSRFYDLFRQETGTVPARYIRDCRFERAKQLLMTTNLSIKEVANHVGVHDDSHFVRHFQKLYGMSPRTFRRAYRNPVPEVDSDAFAGKIANKQ